VGGQSKRWFSTSGADCHNWPAVSKAKCE
jgi:hypothetical protein